MRDIVEERVMRKERNEKAKDEETAVQEHKRTAMCAQISRQIFSALRHVDLRHLLAPSVHSFFVFQSSSKRIVSCLHSTTLAFFEWPLPVTSSSLFSVSLAYLSLLTLVKNTNSRKYKTLHKVRFVCKFLFSLAVLKSSARPFASLPVFSALLHAFL